MRRGASSNTQPRVKARWSRLARATTSIQRRADNASGGQGLPSLPACCLRPQFAQAGPGPSIDAQYRERGPHRFLERRAWFLAKEGDQLAVSKPQRRAPRVARLEDLARRFLEQPGYASTPLLNHRAIQACGDRPPALAPRKASQRAPGPRRAERMPACTVSDPSACVLML